MFRTGRFNKINIASNIVVPLDVSFMEIRQVTLFKVLVSIKILYYGILLKEVFIHKNSERKYISKLKVSGMLLAFLTLP